jgi:hypothetical protein
LELVFGQQSGSLTIGVYFFPRYTNKSSCNSNSASPTANKWLKSEVNKESVVHGLRHSYRDRLRPIEAPTELIDQLGGWSKNTVGQNYGNEYSIGLLHSWASKITQFWPRNPTSLGLG